MDEKSNDVNSGGLSEPERRGGQSALIRVALANTVISSIVLGSMASLFVLRLGGTAFHVGVRTTLAYISPLGQLWGLCLLARLGKARLAVWGRLAAIVPLMLLVGLAASGQTGPLWIWLAILTFGGLSLANVVGNTGWWPLLQDNTEGEGIGGFFSRMRLKLRVMEVGLPLFAGAFLGRQALPNRFVLPFAIGIAGASFSAWFMRVVPERRIAVPRTGLFRRLLEAAKVPSVRSYTIFLSAHDFVIMLPYAFWVVMLKARGLPDNQIMWLVPVAALGHMAGLNLWARMVDKHGSRPVVSTTTIAEALLGLAWLFLPARGTPLLVWAVAFNLVWGLLDGGFLMGRTQAMMDAIPTFCQMDGFTLATLLAAVGGALGSLVGAVWFQWLTDAAPVFGGMDQRLVYLAGTQVCLIGVWLASRRLARYAHETPTSRLMGEVWRRLVGEKEGAAQ
jgi:hypothetical protein